MGKSVNYKAVTIGKTLAETNNITFTYNGKCLKPFSPVHVKAEKDKDNNINITWLRRSRVDNDWRDYVDIPLGEESPKYEIDIKKKKKIIRTLTSNIEAVTYTKEQINTDFINLPNELTATIYQLSSIVGRGYDITIQLNSRSFRQDKFEEEPAQRI